MDWALKTQNFLAGQFTEPNEYASLLAKLPVSGDFWFSINHYHLDGF